MPPGYLDKSTFPAASGARAENKPYRMAGQFDIPVGSGVTSWMRGNWRHNDPEALNFDLDAAERKQAEADALSRAAASIGNTGFGLEGVQYGRGKGMRVPSWFALPARALRWPVIAGAKAAEELAGMERTRWENAANELRAQKERVGRQGR